MNFPSFFEDSMSQESDTRLSSSPLVSNLRKCVATYPQEFNQSPWRPAFSSSSPIGLIHVLGYATNEGSEGNSITANINFFYHGGEGAVMRFVVGRRAIATTVTDIPDQTYGRWQLKGTIPHFSVHQTNTTRFSLAVQAFDLEGVPLDHVEFGEYTYWGSEVPRQSRLQRRNNSQSGQKRQMENIGPMAVLNLITPVNTMCHGWDDTERQNKRRLVRFHKVQEDCTLNVTCEGIHISEYREMDAVVSCIRRDDDGSHCITSVDIINLLEKLVDEKFGVDEKNRIRRNIEGLKPTPLKKGQSDSKSEASKLYNRIMDYPDPKPCNIKKDIKVFDWNILPQALLKIISRYSLVSQSGGETIHCPQEAAPTHAERGPPEDGSAGVSDGELAPENHNTELKLVYPPEESVSPRNSPGNLHSRTVGKDYAADLQGVLFASESPFYAYDGINIAPQLSPLNFDHGGYASNFIKEGSPTTSWRAALVKVEDVELEETMPFEEPMEIRNRPYYVYDNCGIQTYDSLEFQALREPNVLFSDPFCPI